MKRIAMVVSMAMTYSLVATADGICESSCVELCRNAISTARAAGTWHWKQRTNVREDAGFEREIRAVLKLHAPAAYKAVVQRGQVDDVAGLRNLRKAFPAAVRETETWQKILARSVSEGYGPNMQLDVGEVTLVPTTDGTRTLEAVICVSGRSSNVMDVLRYSLGQLRALGRRAEPTLENVPSSWYEEHREGVPTFESRCLDFNGRFKYICTYRMNSSAECMWDSRVRRCGRIRKYADVDQGNVWNLLARNPSEYTYEGVLKILGRPTRSVSQHCRQCGHSEQKWVYEISDVDNAGDAIRHLLTFVYAAGGKCVGWTWCSE